MTFGAAGPSISGVPSPIRNGATLPREIRQTPQASRRVSASFWCSFVRHCLGAQPDIGLTFSFHLQTLCCEWKSFPLQFLSSGPQNRRKDLTWPLSASTTAKRCRSVRNRKRRVRFKSTRHRTALRSNSSRITRCGTREALSDIFVRQLRCALPRPRRRQLGRTQPAFPQGHRKKNGKGLITNPKILTRHVFGLFQAQNAEHSGSNIF